MAKRPKNRGKKAAVAQVADTDAPPDGSPLRFEWHNMIELVDAFEIESTEDFSDDNDDASVVTTASGTRLKVKTVRFRVGDDVILESGLAGTQNIWVGRIKQIRKRHIEDDVWLKIRWYYSGHDVVNRIARFSPAICAPYERIVSDTEDIISAQSVLGVTFVHEYDECDLDPPDLQEDQFFTRAMLHYNRKLIAPKPGSNTCICHQPYVPFPPLETDGRQGRNHRTAPKYGFMDANGRMLYSLPQEERTHFCPKPSCRRCGDRGLRLIAVSPVSDQECPTLASYSAQTTGDSAMDVDRPQICAGEAQGSAHAPQMSLEGALHAMQIASRVAHLPPELLRVAQAPIVRRPGPAMGGWSAVGNVRDVVLARQIFYAALERDAQQRAHSDQLAALADRLDHVESTRARSDGGDAMAANARLQVFSDIDNKLSDLANAGILLASPYLPYWSRRERDCATWDSEPPFVCPACKGAI